MTRRDLLRLLLASPLATTFDVERALWVPKPIIVVPKIPSIGVLVQRVKEFSGEIEITSFLDDYRSYVPGFDKLSPAVECKLWEYAFGKSDHHAGDAALSGAPGSAKSGEREVDKS